MRLVLALFLAFWAVFGVATVVSPARAEDYACKATEAGRAAIHNIANKAKGVVLNLDKDQSQRFMDYVNAQPPESHIKADTVTLIVTRDYNSLAFWAVGDKTCGAIRLDAAATQAAIALSVGNPA
jgi:hypothetical protein